MSRKEYGTLPLAHCPSLRASLGEPTWTWDEDRRSVWDVMMSRESPGLVKVILLCPWLCKLPPLSLSTAVQPAPHVPSHGDFL